MRSPRGDGQGNAWRLWADVASQASASLGDHRLRTFLSVLGVAIGIAAVILIGVVSRGGKAVVFSELQTFGLRSVWIMRDYRTFDPRRIIRPGTGLDDDDYAIVRDSGCCKVLRKVTPVVFAGKGIPNFVHAGRLYSQVRVEGVGSAYLEINNDTIVIGRPFSEDDILQARRVVIIGDQARTNLFIDADSPIGRDVWLGNEKFEVIGVLAHKDRSLLASIGSAGGQDSNSRLLLPYSRLQAISGGRDIDLLQGELASDAVPAAAATREVIDYLRRRHRGAYDYRAETMEQYVNTANNILGGVSLIGVVAASVSLLVAGLGIMNIMTTSVLERTREIGIRKALGGAEREIRLQFLLEAGLISSIGGLLGLIAGAGSSVLIASLTGLPFSPSVPEILLAMFVSMAVGLSAGVYPAYRAAQLDPVEALRHE